MTDPDAFRPQRWLDGDGEGGEPEVPVPTPEPFMPFGNGPRFCPGRNLAMVEATLIASTVCRNVRVLPDTAGRPPVDRFAFTVQPDNVSARLAPRSTVTAA